MRLRQRDTAEWSDHQNQIIRVVSPEVAADKLGWTLNDVLARRRELGLEDDPIRKRNSKRQGARWTAKEDKLVTTLSLAEAAKQTGRTYAAVKMRRVLLRKRGRKVGNRDARNTRLGALASKR